MGDQIEDNYNDLMDDINDHRERREIASVSNDSNLGSSVTNFGVDVDNAEENAQYILENQDPHAVIQGVGVGAVGDRIVVTTKSESGLSTSISKTRSSEFFPIIIEYPREQSLETQSLLSDTSECDVDNEVVDDETNSNAINNEELENLTEQLQDLELTSFDLAIKKGYLEQAIVYYNHYRGDGDEYYEVVAKMLRPSSQCYSCSRDIN